MRIILLSIAIVTMLSSCDRTPGGMEITAEDLVDQVGGGPDVQGVKASLEKNAIDATERGEYEKAIQLYSHLLDRSPDNVSYLNQYAFVLRRSGDPKKAFETYKLALKHDANNTEALEGKGISLLLMAEFDEAVKILSDVLEKDASRWKTVNAIGIALSARGKYDEAIQYYQAALQLDSLNTSIITNMALTYALKQDYKRAKTELERAAKLVDSKDKDKKMRIDHNLALVYGFLGELDKAESILEKYFSKHQKYNNLAYLASIADQPDLAKSYLNMALSASPSFYQKAWENLEQINKKGKIR